MFISYDESILAYVASIRQYFGLDSAFPADKKFSDLIAKRRPKKIFLFLVDGMGANLIRRKLSPDSFLRKHLFAITQTIFPATTTAATTAIQNGKAANENAWLGWTQYLKEIDDFIIPFKGIGFYNNIAYDPDLMERAVPLSTTEDELNKIGIPARILYPAFREDGCDSFDLMCSRLIDYSHSDEYRYIYAYWDRYDTFMHEHGPDSKICDAYLQYLGAELENLNDNLADDTMLVITADHGQITVKRIYNLYGSEYEKYFARKPSLEFRAQAFFIRKGMEEEFARKFKAEFENDFILLSHQQVLESKLFGPHENHPRFEEFIGDFLAIGKSDMAFVYNEKEKKPMRGQHAGICDDEIMVPVIVP